MWACFSFLICKVGYTAMWKFNWLQFCLFLLASLCFICISLLYLWTTNEQHQKTVYYAKLPEKQLTFVKHHKPITLATFSRWKQLMEVTKDEIHFKLKDYRELFQIHAVVDILWVNKCWRAPITYLKNEGYWISAYISIVDS